MLFFITLLYCFFSIVNNAQTKVEGKNKPFSNLPDTLFATKAICNDNYKLKIVESKFFEKEKTCGDYSYNLLWNATKQQKVSLIENLLQFELDTSLSCCPVYCYSNAAKKYTSSIGSTRYTLQIEALYNINLICFAEYAPFKYAPFPVLYDTLSKCEINNDFKKIAEVFTIYKEWFELNKKNGFKNYTFPLINTRYKWIYGSNSLDKIFENFPIIKSDYKFRVGIKVSD